MNYKKAQHNESDVANDGVKIFGVSLLVWILSGFVFLALAAYFSNTIG